MNGLVIDGFCGGGGASTGISRALGRVDVAINHDPEEHDVDSFAAGHAEEPRLHARDYAVKPAPFTEARAFVVAHHYARGASNTASECHGLYRGGQLVGAALWLPPTRVCAESVAGPAWRTCLSLSRLAVHPDIPKNGASFLVGRSIRIIRAGRRWTHLVTFADESQGHTGAIYRATNWRYVGRTKPEARFEDASGRQVSRLATKSRTRAEMEALGCRMVGKFSKHKFVMVLREAE